MNENTIWKFEAEVADEVVIAMPEPAVILDVKAPAPDRLLVWAVVRPDAPTMEKKLLVRGTGHHLGDVGAHLATLPVGPFVWHVFEKYEPLS